MSIGNLADPKNLTSGLQIYSNTITAKNLTVAPTAGQEYTFPSTRGAAGDVMTVQADPSLLRFDENVLSAMCWGAVMAGPGPQYLKIAGNTSSAPGVVEDLNSIAYIPYKSIIKKIGRSVQTVAGDTTWNIVINGASNVVSLPATMNNFNLAVPAGASVSVAYQAGTAPDGASIILWFSRTY